MERITAMALFEDFTPAEMREILPLFAQRVYLKGATIIRQGEVATCLYIIQHGSVELVYKPYDDKELRLTTLHVEDAFGWSSVLGNSLYSSSVIALEDSNVFIICGEKLAAFRTRNPGIGEKVLQRLAKSVAARKMSAENQVESLLRSGRLNDQWKGDEPMKKKVDSPKNEQIRDLLMNISSYIEQYHGGSVEFVSLDGNILLVKLGGACLGCPLSPATLHGWIEGTVKQFFPEIKEVKNIAD